MGTAYFLDWEQIPVPDVEGKLSILCDMVQQADRLGRAYGLALPGRRIAPSTGPAHRLECLKALAFFGDTERQE